MSYELVYLMISGAGTSRHTPGLVTGLLDLVPEVLCIPTPNAAMTTAMRELSIIPGNRVVEAYFDAAIRPHPRFGVVLFAPCTFNSLNKLGAAIADNLPLAITAEAIGRGTPVIVAPSLNAPLARHPRVAQSIAALTEWGVTVIPQADEDRGSVMAPIETILAEVARAIKIDGPRE
ncbi:MAG: flavoprotein [Chloroflexota bacterium]